MNSRIFYRGPSQLDGAPIIGVMTGLVSPSTNTKTGDMLQTYIIREDVPPPYALTHGLDSSICGDCKLRGDGTGLGRSCYVQLKWAPLGVWKYAQRELDLDIVFSRKELAGRFLRMGTYGDPAAIPLDTWNRFLGAVDGWTGYTHQWKNARFQGFKAVCMASVDSDDERDLADLMGWRTFRIVTDLDEVLASREIRCPASAETGHRTTCAQCRLCDGAGTDHRRKNIAIVAHGNRAKKFGTGTLPFGDE